MGQSHGTTHYCRPSLAAHLVGEAGKGLWRGWCLLLAGARCWHRQVDTQLQAGAGANSERVAQLERVSAALEVRDVQVNLRALQAAHKRQTPPCLWAAPDGRARCTPTLVLAQLSRQ